MGGWAGRDKKSQTLAASSWVNPQDWRPSFEEVEEFARKGKNKTPSRKSSFCSTSSSAKDCISSTKILGKPKHFYFISITSAPPGAEDFSSSKLWDLSLESFEIFQERVNPRQFLKHDS